MNRLQLVQEVARLAGVTDSGGPATTVGQSGDYQKVIRYVDLAHEEIQNQYVDWKFLWAQGALQTTPGEGQYVAPADLGVWDVSRVYVGDQPLIFVEYADWEPEERRPGKPDTAVVLPNNRLMLSPTPDKAYTINFDYFVKPAVLTGNDSVPLIPERFRRAIVGRSLILYGNFEAAPDAKAQGEEIYTEYMEKLRLSQLPRRLHTLGRGESIGITVVPQ